jgi:hypothetical protein
LKLTNEQRLEMEQAGVNPDTIDKITDNLVPLETLKKAIREVQEVIGPHGAISRVQAGGVRVAPGTGIGVFEDGVLKTTILPDGNFRVGSNIEDPSTTTLCVFVNDQFYNGEQMGAGDALIGDNSDDSSNMKWDASEGQWQFRLGQTINVYMDTDGSVKAAGGNVNIDRFAVWFKNQQIALAFEDTAGNINTLQVYSDGDNFIVIKNSYGAKGVSYLIDDAAHSVKQIDILDTGIDLATAGLQYKIGGVALGYPLSASSINNTPTDATTYYFGAHPGAALTTTAQRRKIFIPRAGTVKRVDLFITCVAGSNEESTVSFRYDDTTDTAITNTLDLSANPVEVSHSGLSIPVELGHYFEIKWATPTWATDPTAVSLTAQVWIEF